MKLLVSLFETLLNKNVKSKNWKLKRNNFWVTFSDRLFCGVIDHATKLKIWMIHQAASCWCTRHGLKESWTHLLLLFGQSKCMYLVYFCLVLWHNITNKTGYWKQMSLLVFSYNFAYSHTFSNLIYFYTPPHKKCQGIMLYPPKILIVSPSVHLSVRPSVSASFPHSNLSSFWPRIANGLNSFINNRVMALDWCKNVFFLNIFRTKD